MKDTHTWKVRQLKVLARLSVGKPLHAEGFADIYEGLHPKTFRRDMQAWVDTPEFDIRTGRDVRGQWWRMGEVRGMVIPANPKYCTNKCVTHPLAGESFYRDSARPDGLTSQCRACIQAKRRLNRRRAQ